MKKKITSYLSTTGSVSEKAASLTLSNSQTVQILLKCGLPAKDIGLLAPESKKVCIVPNGETILTVKLHDPTNVCKIATELVKLIDSNHIVLEHTESFTKKQMTVIFESYSVIQKDLSANTTVSEALLKENLYDEKIDIIQKIGLVYQKITVIFSLV